ncbi:diguanylate cyclase [Rhizobium deserti]|uniref:diguanylate cyclase n=1 Tax=Rhizobium deserti TaxID=2547961 RepID=A0A4R5UKB2_9HYPH|nr:diguanylate cyclase [Rhizobium deserti]TDK37254.1 diguanylate cyclase [Rhizobium deserti]
MRIPALRSVATTIAVIFGFCAFIALLSWAEYSAWNAQVARVEGSLKQTAEAIAQHTDDVIEMSRLPLAGLIAEINDEVGHPEMPTKIKALITRQMKASPTLDTLSYIDAAGQMVATSSNNAPPGMNYADRDYFRFHKENPFRLPVVGKPIKSRLSNLWVIPITQKVLLQDGSFAGTVVSTIRVNHFINFFRGFDVGSDGAFLLARGDGIVLVRGPIQESMLGTSLAAGELFSRYLKRQTVGAYHYTSPVDQTARSGGYYQSTRTGIVVLASASEQEVFRAWVDTARTRWFYACILLGLALVAALLWQRQARLRRESEALLAAREAEFRLLAESSSDVISRFDENGIREYVSPSAMEILGLEPERLVGRSVYAGMDKLTETLVRDAAERLRNGSTQEKLLIRHTKPDGEHVWLETALSKLPASRDASATRVVAITRDVSRHKNMQDELDVLANTDELTRLANRRFFNTRFEEMVQRARRNATPLTLLMIDADRFKLFNDTYGHAAGDDCLRQIAAVIRDCVRRPGDVAARYGGEELAVLLADTDEQGAAAVAENIRARVEGLALAHEKNPPSGRMTVSIGLATVAAQTGSAITAQALFAQADEALYRAKSSGRNQIVSATPSRPGVPNPAE